MSCRFVLAAIVAGAASCAAHANVFFGFAPPSNGFEREVFYSAGDENGVGSLTFTNTETVQLTVDGSTFGRGIVTYTASLVMNLGVGQVGAPGAPLTGTSSFFIGGVESLVGTVGPGGGVMFGFVGTGALLFSNEQGQDFRWEYGGALVPQLFGIDFNADANAAFALSYTFEHTTNEHGYYNSFSANAAFVGDAEWIVPGPSPVFVLALSAFIQSRRAVRARDRHECGTTDCIMLDRKETICAVS
jgi:hypothetical protein